MNFELNNNFRNLDANELNETNGGIIPIVVTFWGAVKVAGAVITVIGAGQAIHNVIEGAVDGYKEADAKDTP